MDDADLGRRLLELLGEPACRELLAVLEWPEPDRAALIDLLDRIWAKNQIPENEARALAVEAQHATRRRR